jgi:hypothetical protein
MSGAAKLPPPGKACEIASPRLWLPLEFYQTTQRLGIPFTRDVLWARISQQQMLHCVPLRFKNQAHRDRRFPDYVPLRRRYRISTSRFGIGQRAGSNCTPLGLHRVVEKIGGGWPAGTVLRSRRVAGFTWKGLPFAKITSRILWLEGLEPGLNRGGTVDSHARYIYMHGTGNEPTLGRPASCGCIHLAADDLLPLYDQLPSGTLVWIER